MTTKIKISDTQAAVLKAAVKTKGRIEQFPENVNGGARSKVLRALIAAGFIQNEHEGHWLTDAGYAAIGKKRPEVAPVAEAPAEAVAKEKSGKESKIIDAPAPPRRSRENSKQAQVIAMLRRSEGATIAQICETTGWQPHTVRGTFAGAFKKKLDLNVTSEKSGDGARIYRIVDIFAESSV